MKNSSLLWPGLGVATAVLAVVSSYFVLRFAPSPVEITVVLLVILLGALAAFGFIGTNRGHAATFVAIALVLPYVLIGVVTYASAQRASSELESVFDDSDFSSDDTDFPFDDESDFVGGDGTYGSDPELDVLQDQCVAGDQAACEDLYLQSPPGSEYESTAEANGGGSGF